MGGLGRLFWDMLGTCFGDLVEAVLNCIYCTMFGDVFQLTETHEHNT